MSATSNVYKAAHEGAIWRDMSHFGRFSFRGADSASLLHHLTTNNIKSLAVEQGCDTVLINSKARILDLLSVFRRHNDFLVFTSPNRRAMFAPHAQKFILYRQDVTIEDVTDSSGMLGVFGANAHRVLELLGFVDINNEENTVQQFVIKDLEIFGVWTKRLPLGGFFLWSDNRSALLQFLQESEVPQCDNETYNTLRIEAGLPVAGLELTEDVNPWEAGLNNAISLHKGCYNGQEIIARLNTYQKVKRRLRGLKLSSNETFSTALKADGKDVGMITSRVVSPRFSAIALAFVRSDFAENGQQLQLEDSSQTATVCDLPFNS